MYLFVHKFYLNEVYLKSQVFEKGGAREREKERMIMSQKKNWRQRHIREGDSKKGIGGK